MKNKKLKILQAIYCLGRGGAERLVIDITRELATYPNVEVLLISFDKTVDYEYSTEGINYRFCPASVNLSILKPSKISIHNYTSIIKEFNPDIIHSHRYLADVITREKINENIVYFSHCHDNMAQLKIFSVKTIFNKLALTNFFEKRRLMPKYIECNNQFIAISDDTKKYFERVLPAKLHGNIHKLNNAIDFARFNGADNKRLLDKIRIVNVGSFVSKKNQIFLVEIMKYLKQKNIDATLDFLGDGMQLNYVKEKAAEYGLSDLVSFHGNVSNVTDYLKSANIYVHTANYEPFGLVIIEAMAAGLPVISLDGIGNRGLVTNDWNGFFIENENVELFAEKISALIKDETKYSGMSKNAVEFSKKFDIKNYVEQLMGLYKSHLK